MRIPPVSRASGWPQALRSADNWRWSQREGSGWDVLRRVTAAGGRRGAPVLAVVPSGNYGVEERALAGGASDFVRTPFTDAVLRHRVARLVSSGEDRRSLEEIRARTRTLE